MPNIKLNEEHKSILYLQKLALLGTSRSSFIPGNAFYDFLLQWRRDVAFAGFEVPIQMDVSAEKMIFGVSGIDPQRRAELIKVRCESEIPNLQSCDAM